MGENDTDTHFGMKRLNAQNWTVPDVPRFFSIQESQWIEAIMREKLIPQVPEEVQRMFEVARGAIAYGWFFYPLLTLASEQLYRIHESAARAKCEQVGIPLRVQRGKRTVDRSFQELIKALSSDGFILPESTDEWDAARDLRNWASHPRGQTILPPGYALDGIHSCALKINQLFAERPDEFSRLALQVRKATGFDDAKLKFPRVAGVDVGGATKGFHVVILAERQIEQAIQVGTPAEVRELCERHHVQTVAVDAPCGWSSGSDPRAREAERILCDIGLSCFRTPTRAIASANAFYGWMFNGEALYAELTKSFRLFDGTSGSLHKPTCFETYPFAASLGLSGRRLKAADKHDDRRRLLRAAGIDTAALSNIDLVDAAICSLVACSFVADRVTIAGNTNEGFIVLPHI